jgi:chemotaxis protein MotA
MKINLPTILGYLAVVGFIYGIVAYLTSNPMIFVNLEAIVVIFGGLVVSAFASFPWITLRQSAHSLHKIMTDPPSIPTLEARQVVELSKMSHKKGLQALEPEVEKIEHPFLKEAVELMLNGIPQHTLREILEKRISERRETLAQDVNVMLTLSKYCPALGLGATVLGLVELLSKLKNADLGELGAGMAVALSATFFGIMVANLLFAPLSELLLSAGETDHRTREMILDGILAIGERKHPLVVGEMLNSHLPLRYRVDFASELSMGSDAPGESRSAAA